MLLPPRAVWPLALFLASLSVSARAQAPADPEPPVAEEAPADAGPGDEGTPDEAPPDEGTLEQANPEEASAEAGPEEPGTSDESSPSPEGGAALAAPVELPSPLEPGADVPDAAGRPGLSAADAVGASVRTLTGPRLGVWAETGLTGDGTDGREMVGWSSEIGLRFPVIRGLTADASWGWTVASVAVAGVEPIGGEPTPFEAELVRFDPANPTIAIAYEDGVSPQARLRVGLGVAIPSAARAQPGDDADSLAARAASEVSNLAAMSMRGWWSPWRFAPERFGLFVPLRLAAAIDAVRLEGEAGVGVLMPVLGDRGVDVDVILQLAGGVSGQVAGPLYLGGRVRAVGGATGVLLPDAVVSLEPHARLVIDDAQLTARGVLNLSGADRLASTRGPSFGVFLGAGGAI